MADIIPTPQVIINAGVDSKTIEDTVNGAPNIEVTSRLGRKFWTLATINARVERTTQESDAAIAQIQEAKDSTQAALDSAVQEFNEQGDAVLTEFRDAVQAIVDEDGVPAEVVKVGDSTLDIIIPLKADKSEIVNKVEAQKSGVNNTPNVTEFPKWNAITSGAAASQVTAGTNQQPNLIGWNVNLKEFDCDGVTKLFTVENTFPVVLNPEKEIVRVAIIRKSDGVRFPQVAGNQYSITIDTNNQVNIDFITPPESIYTVWIRVIGSEQNNSTPLLNFITNGYDNVTDGAGPMLEMTGAHHTELNNPSGHNTYAGGSYNQMINGCSYSFVGGHENHLEGVSFGSLLGGRNTVKNSSGVFVAGQNIKVSNSTGVLVGGHDHNFDGKPYTVVGGRAAIPIASGGVAIGNGKSGDARAGLRQFDIFGLSKTTTDATEGFLSQNSGTSLNILNVTSAAFVTAEVIATSSDGNDQKTFLVKFCAKRVGGVATLIGTPIVVSDFATENAATWSLRVQTASNGFYLRQTGEAGKTIRWMASVKVTSSAFDAP